MEWFIFYIIIGVACGFVVLRILNKKPEDYNDNYAVSALLTALSWPLAVPIGALYLAYESYSKELAKRRRRAKRD